MALTPRLHSVLPPQYHRSAQQSLLGRSYAYDRGAGTVTFPEQYGVRIGKGAMDAHGTVECRTPQRAISFRAVQPASRHAQGSGTVYSQ